MPRQDMYMTPEELQHLRSAAVRAENLFRSNNRLQARWEYGERCPDMLRVWEGHPDRDAWHSFAIGNVIGCLFPDPVRSNTEVCRQCQYSYRVEGCTYCRPTLFSHCECGAQIVTGAPCECWEECPECGVVARLPVFVHGMWHNTNLCSEACAEARDYVLCEGPRDEDGELESSDYYYGCTNWTSYEDQMCDSCRPCTCGGCSECRSRANIHSYSYKPLPNFLGDGPLYLGLECEINVGAADRSRSTIARAVNRVLGDGEIGYLKSDSSIGEGFEIVTHPMSYPYAMSDFPWELYDTLQEYGVENDERCGIHVHASRAGFSGTRHVYMWQRFFYRNDEAICQLARRRSDMWARFDGNGRQLAALVAKTGGHSSEYVDCAAWYLPSQRRESYRRGGYVPGMRVSSPMANRYSAINSQNYHTLEVRVFASSTEATPVKAALGLVHASIEYTRTLDAQSVLKKDGWRWEPFRNWVGDRADIYPALNSEIERLVTV